MRPAKLDASALASPEPAPLPAEHGPNATVLVVDDEPGMRNILLRTLAPRSGQVPAASSADEAEALLQHRRFDLVVLDITLPGNSGPLPGDLREQGNTCEVVLINAIVDLDTAIERRADAGDFLLQPFRGTQVT